MQGIYPDFRPQIVFHCMHEKAALSAAAPAVVGMGGAKVVSKAPLLVESDCNDVSLGPYYNYYSDKDGVQAPDGGCMETGASSCGL